MTPRLPSVRASIAATSVVVAALLALQPRAAAAQSAAAEATFQDGEKLMAAGKLAEACDAFAASNRLEPRAGTLIRLGDCREQNRQLASAWSAYTDALARVKDPKKRKIATAQVAALEPRLSKLTIEVSPAAAAVPGLTIERDGEPVDRALWNRPLPFDGGDYVFTAKAPGMADAAVTVSVPIERGAVTAQIPTLAPPAVATPAPPTPLPVAGAEVRGESPSRFTGKRKVALGLATVGVVGLALGGVLGAQASSLEDDAFALCPDPAMPCGDAVQATDKLDSAQQRALFANVAFGVGAAAVVGAAVLWLTGAPDDAPPRTALVPRAGGDFLGVALTGGF